ncbi:MAG: ABC transporter permease [Ruminococcus sp.]|nr:ABC transporter permease [Ruminococcus sp.]
MRDPLNKRLGKQLREELGKYTIIFLFFVMMIGATSGFIVSDTGMIDAYNESFEKYSIEDGNLEFMLKPEDSVLEDIEKDGGIKLYENYYKDEETDSFDSTLRIYGERSEIDRLCIWEGELPSAKNDIALDRLYAKNHSLKPGSSFQVSGRTLNVCGIVAFTDYSALYESPTDLMFDNDMFGVGAMTDEGFEAFNDDHLHYSYSWMYDKSPANDSEAQDMSEELVKTVSEKAMLQNFIPAYSNQAIHFAGNDLHNDRTSMLTFLYITMVILAFIFVVTTESTIAKEASVIGTLRASGYTKLEMIRHYMKLPMYTLLAASVVGNVIGYTLLEKYMAAAYLGSYSLTTYEVSFNADAFLLTTVIPFVIMFVINLTALARKLSLSPLKFLRRDLSRGQKKKAFRLNTGIGIMTRFRLRIFFQNIPGYIVIIFGIILGYSILFFGLMFEPMLDNFKEETLNNMIADNIYVLRMPVETDDQNAEKAAMLSLETTFEKYKAEDVSVYGIADDSKFVKIDHGKGVSISTAMMNKYGLEKGDRLKLTEKYSDKDYEFTITGSYDYPASIAIFMDLDSFCETFELDDGYFNIYFSDDKLEDIDERLIMSRITEEDMTKTSRQMTRSMGSIMNVFKWFGVAMFVMVIYLLAKLIIEKNAQSISMTKILGYYDREINGLYVHTTTIVALLSMLCTLPLVDFLIGAIFKMVFMNYSGYFAYETDLTVMLKCLIIGIVSYSLVAFVLNRSVKKIPLAEALKNAE